MLREFAGPPPPRYGRHVADPLSSDAFYESARDFAQRALQAHHAREFRRVALEAGTALEHLAKACLAKRSPALLIELKGEGNFRSLLGLLGIPHGRPLAQLRTVSLRDALARMKTFVRSGASDDDLRALVDMRDGTVHSALDDEVEQRLLVAFAMQANTFLWDLGRPEKEFWGTYYPLVDTLQEYVSDRISHDVEVKIAAARADFRQRYGEGPAEILEVVRRLAGSRVRDDDQEPCPCPACESAGMATGDHDVEREPEWDADRPLNVFGTVWFSPSGFECSVCGLRLGSVAELAAAGVPARWEIENADPLKYDTPVDDDSAYEVWRESRHEREE